MKVILASHNLGKITEIQAMLASSHIKIIPQSEYHITDIEETGLTFVENAILKARHAAKLTGLPAIADDSGLEVDALNGAPGIYSARYAGEHGNNAANIEKLLAKLKTVPMAQRTARFQSVMVYLRHELDPSPLITQGTWQGSIMTTPEGDGGFGYDPIFYVPTHHCSAAQMPSEEKNAISHRGQSLSQLSRLLNHV